jgi:hypothetical protein
MSPLLRALTFSRTAHEPVTEAMLMQCYTALDAFRRGHGSRDLHMTLSRHLLVSQELARLGLGMEWLGDIERAHAAMVQVDEREHEHHGAGWTLDDSEYRRLSDALAVLDAQLAAASLSDVASAEARMIEGLMRSAQNRVVAEATV